MAEINQKYLDDVELVQNLIKTYRDNNPPAIKAGEVESVNTPLVMVLVFLLGFGGILSFFSSAFFAVFTGLVIAIAFFCWLCKSFVIKKVRINEWTNDYVSQDDFEKMSVCNVKFKEMVNQYAKETQRDVTYSALAELIERYKYEVKKEQKKPPFDVAS
ncbi:hypothetical protein R5Q34_004587 [Salmonella enterica]|nr:hypothetical protein [Salmonella enterica]